jgi:hypothetical protein
VFAIGVKVVMLKGGNRLGLPLLGYVVDLSVLGCLPNPQPLKGGAFLEGINFCLSNKNAIVFCNLCRTPL